MEFTSLERPDQLETIQNGKGYHVIFKHNTTCPISKGVKAGLEAELTALKGAQAIYYLDLLAHRDISNAIAEQYGIAHQSPQVLLIHGGECVYTQWGYDIRAAEIAEKMI